MSANRPVAPPTNMGTNMGTITAIVMTMGMITTMATPIITTTITTMITAMITGRMTTDPALLPDETVQPSSAALQGAALVRLLTWLSPAFPLGTFSYSHGLETAISEGTCMTGTASATGSNSF